MSTNREAAGEALPDGLLLAFYGDDFTGSTDAMEVLAFAGLPTVLFVKPPTPAALQRFRHHRAIGIAGTARSRSPAWMDEHLPPIFRTLFSLAAPITQYKVCSTFDSSPVVGSIGRAIDLALPLAAEGWSPLVVGAPQLQRWQAFGNLFAGAGPARHRLDRHPTMSRHPMTPMAEADLARHLAQQTALPVSLVDVVDLMRGDGDDALQEARRRGRVVSFDVMDEAGQAEVGRLIWRNRGKGLFSAASSGLEYALVAWWRAAGLLPPSDEIRLPAVAPVDRLLVLSGSCSPATGEQIAHAISAGFVPCPLDALRVADPSTRQAELDRIVQAASSALQSGRDVLVYTAQGQDDAAIANLREHCAAAGTSLVQAQECLGDALGRIASDLLQRHALPRIVLAGGDTSGRIVAQLPIDALEAVSPLAKGSPLCRCHSEVPRFSGMELIMKGGQVGLADFFVAAKGAGRLHHPDARLSTNRGPSQTD